jgi:hypothetical protein
MTYVNYRGEEIGLIDHGRAPKAKRDEKSYHNGWSVQGIPPGSLEDARAAHKRLTDMARNSGGKEIKAWDEEHYLMNAKRQPVRRKPFEIPGAATECKALAERMGWLRVEIVELKKEVRAA